MNVYDSFSSEESDLVGQSVLEPKPFNVNLAEKEIKLPREEDIIYSDTDDVLVLYNFRKTSSQDILFVDQSRFNTSIAIREEFLVDGDGTDGGVDDGTLEVNVIERLCDSTQWTSRDIPNGTGDHEQFRFIINSNYLVKLCTFYLITYLKWQ